MQLDGILDRIDALEKETTSEVQDAVQKRLDPERIQKTIERFFDEKSDAKDRLLAILMERIESSVDHIIEEHTDRLVGDISDDVDMRAELSIDVGNEETVGAPFDMRGAFARGIAGLATVGGLSTWAASLGNMGGYMVGHILAIRGPSAASAVGIRLSGGVATATVRLSALGTGGLPL